MIRIVVTGDTEFTNFQYMKRSLNDLINEKCRIVSGIQIICGGREGAECLGQRYAEQEGLRSMVYWPRDKRHAEWMRAFRRMTDHAARSDEGIVVWFGRTVTEWDEAALGYAKSLGLTIVRK